MRYSRLFALVLLTLLAACGPDPDPEPTVINQPETFGTLLWRDDPATGGCGWLLSFRGGSYVVENLEPELQYDGGRFGMRTLDTGETVSCTASDEANERPLVNFDYSFSNLELVYYPSTQCANPWLEIPEESAEDKLIGYLDVYGLTPYFVAVIEAPDQLAACDSCQCRAGEYQVVGVPFGGTDDYTALGFVTDPALLEGE